MNHLQTPEYKELLNLVLESEGGTLGQEKRRVLDFVAPFAFSKDSCWYFLQQGHYESQGGKNRNFDINEIYNFTMPILSLDRILMALAKFNKYSVNCHGQFLEDKPGKTYGTGYVENIFNWELGKPAHFQSLETIKKLLFGGAFTIEFSKRLNQRLKKVKTVKQI